MPSPVLQFKRGAFANLPGLRAGEPALTTDSFDLYVGIDSTTNNNKFFGSHRYWKKETTTVGSGINLVEGTSNGSDFITLKSPNSLSGITTYTFPAVPTDNYYLKTNASGDLSWAAVVSDFYIAADSGTPDLVSTGSTITFVGGTNVNTAVTDQTVTINLDSGISLTNINASGIVTAATLAGVTTVDATTKATLEAVLGAEPNTFSNLLVSGISTFQGAIDANGGATIDNIQIGVTNDNKIDTVAGVLELDSAAGKVVVQDNVEIYGNLDITGNVSVGGTAFTITTSDLYVTSRDIVVGYTTASLPTDNTANHGGIAIASTEGTPLVSFSISGINTLPDTYKQMMWFESGALGFQEDMFAFNYGVAVGTTVAPLGTRFAVGTGITMSDTAIKATNFYGSFSGSLSGNATSADTVKTITASDTQGTYYVTFVDANNGSATNETVYTDDGIYYNPGANKLTTQHAEFTGNVLVSGISTFSNSITGTISTATRATTVDTTATSTNADYYVTFVDTLAGQTGETLRVGAGLSINPSDGSVKTKGILSVGDPNAVTSYIKAGGGSNAMYLYGNGDVSFQAKIIASEIRSQTNATTLLTLNGLDATFANNVTVTGITTSSGGFVGNLTGTATTATTATNANFVNITAQTSDDNVYYIPFESGIGHTSLYIDTALSYNPGQDKLTTTNIDATRVVLSEGITAAGFVTTTSGFVGGLSGNVTGNINSSGVSTITTLNSTTVKATNLQAADGAAAITISSGFGDVVTSANLTVNGDLYVNGNTTQINTTELTVEDRTITLGIQTGATPTTTTWDLGVMMNYGDAGVAKTAGVIWDYSVERFVFSANSDNPASGSNTSTPIITVAAHAPIEIASLWVNDCAGQSQVISCTGNERFLENITVDAGTF